jgi:uncharacterized protein DUF1236
MRYRVLASAAISASIIATGTAFAQTVGVAGAAPGIAAEQRPAFHEYVIRERIPNHTIPDRVVVGGVLPDAGVTYYDVPQTFGPTAYRYTVINGHALLVEPRTRRIIQIID